MYDINVKNVRKGNNIMYIFLLVGIIFFVILHKICYNQGIFIRNGVIDHG